MKAATFYLLNLGCAKNLVEGEHLAGMLLHAGWQAVTDPADAGMLIVNTCGFIKPAVQEAVEAILSLNAGKKPGQFMVVVGCLVGRYGKKLVRSLPEVDLLVAPGEMHRLMEHLDRPPANRLAISPPRRIFTSQAPRTLATGPGWAYLRIADGCGHKCAFCTIPHIRGPLRSRETDDVLAEVARLAEDGVVEINLVAQDLTAYGQDIYGYSALNKLIGELASIDLLKWIRLLYLHPDSLDNSLLKKVLETPKVLKYFDLPLQHVADPVLRAMGREKTGENLRELVRTIRQGHPEATLRATLLVGHPGEGTAEFEALLEFVEQGWFDHLGCFAYQPEPGTKSALLKAPQAKEGLQRQKKIMAAQKKISRQRLARLKGQKTEVLVLGPHPESELLWQGRLSSQAPEVDGEVIITGGYARPGTIATAVITKTHAYDVEAEVME